MSMSRIVPNVGHDITPTPRYNNRKDLPTKSMSNIIRLLADIVLSSYTKLKGPAIYNSRFHDLWWCDLRHDLWCDLRHDFWSTCSAVTLRLATRYAILLATWHATRLAIWFASSNTQVSLWHIACSHWSPSHMQSQNTHICVSRGQDLTIKSSVMEKYDQ